MVTDGLGPLDAVDQNLGLADGCATRFTRLLIESDVDVPPRLLDVAQRWQSEHRGTGQICPVIQVAAQYDGGGEPTGPPTPDTVTDRGDGPPGLPRDLADAFRERFGGLDCLRIANLYEDSIGLWGLQYSAGGTDACEQVIQECLASVKSRSDHGG